MGKNDYLNEFKYFNPWILHTGLVTWVPEVRLHTKCVIKVKDFPFDVQCCEINFYSWAHTSAQMVILQYEDKNVTNITHLAMNTEWIIYDTCALNKTITTSKDLHWSVTSYVLYIKRESIYHFYTLLMPCVVLSVLSVLLFWLPPDSNEKITLGVTILLAFFVNSLVVSDYTPEASSELPVIGVYYTFNIFFVALSLSGSVLILKFHFRGHRLNKAPEWLKKVLFIDSVELARQRSNSSLLNLSTSTSFKRLNQKTFPVLKRFPYDLSNLSYQLDNDYSRTKTFSLTSNVPISTNLNHIDHKQVNKASKLIKLLKCNFKKLDDDRVIIKNVQEIIIEWKEIARRLEYVFLAISFITIIIAPIILFGKFFVRDVLKKMPPITSCGCEHSFVN